MTSPGSAPGIDAKRLHREIADQDYMCGNANVKLLVCYAAFVGVSIDDLGTLDAFAKLICG